MLTPPLQFHRGSAWTSVEIPDNFGMAIELSIPEGTYGGGFAIWLIREFGATGTFFGGSPHFEGISVVGRVSQAESAGSIEFFVLEGRGDENFVEIVPTLEPSFWLNFSPDRSLSLELKIKEKLLFLSCDTGLGQGYYNQELEVDITDHYLGITAQCDKQTSRFDILGVGFSVEVERFQRRVFLEPSSGRWFPEKPLKIRNPKFLKLRELLKNRTNSSADSLFELIDEFHNVLNDVATFSFVDRFVRTILDPYVDKWYRRSTKLTESIASALGVIASACNYTEALVGTFNSTLTDSSDRMTEKLISLAELVGDDAQQAAGIRFAFEVESIDLKGVVAYAMAIELFMVLAFLTMMRSAKLREQVIMPKKRHRRK
jgi:hypothetical protein